MSLPIWPSSGGGGGGGGGWLMGLCTTVIEPYHDNLLQVDAYLADPSSGGGGGGLAHGTMYHSSRAIS